MKAHSLTTRVLRGTVFVTLVTALAGAATAALLARSLWQAHEHSTLLELAEGLAQAVDREAAEEGTTPESAAAEALRTSVARRQVHRCESKRADALERGLPRLERREIVNADWLSGLVLRGIGADD